MSIILEANYAKKLGLPGYSSHQYSVSIRTELSDLSQVEQENCRLYRLLQDAVDREIQNVGFIPDPNTYGASGRRLNGRHPAANGHAPVPLAILNRLPSHPWNCSDKQKTFIQQLVREAELDKNVVDGIARSMFGAGVRQLNRLQASGLIDELIRRHGRGNRPEPAVNGTVNGSCHANMPHLADQVRSVATPNGGGRT